MSQEDRIPGYAWFVLWMGWAVIIVGAVGSFAIGTLLPSMQEDIGFGTAQAGWLSGAGWLVTSLVTIPITFIVTRVRPKIVLLVVFITMAVAWILQGLVNTFPTLFITRAIGVGMAAAVMPALVLLKQQWVPLSKMGTVNGVNTNLGEMVMVVLAVILIGGLDSLIGCIVGGLIMAVGTNLVAYYLGSVFPGIESYFSMVLILVIVLVRPSGLFGTRPIERV